MDLTKLNVSKPKTKVLVKKIRTSINGGVSASFKAYFETLEFNEHNQLYIAYDTLLETLKDFESNEINKIEINENLHLDLRKMFGFARYLNKNNEFKKVYSVSNTINPETIDKDLETGNMFKYNGEFYNSLLVVKK
jgi:hypothetical protein